MSARLERPARPRPMASLAALASAAMLAALLAGCGAAPTRPQWAVEPLLRVEHGGDDAAEALYRVGRYHQQRGEAAAADDAFARAIALRPDRLDARNARAVLLAGAGRQAEAIDLLRQLAADFPLQAQPLNNLGYLYSLQGQTGPARAALEQALRIDPLHAQARANLARLAPADAAGATTDAAALAAAPAPAGPAADDGAARARWQLVPLAPNEFSLQAVAAAAPPAPSAAKTPDGRDGDGGAIQIVNGNGVRGLGERTRRLLAEAGALDAAAGADVVNQRGHHQRETIIEYLPGQRERAGLVRAALKGRARLLPARALPGGLALRLVLGRDHAEPQRTRAARSVRANGTAPPKRLPDAPLLTMNSSAAPHFNQE